MFFHRGSAGHDALHLEVESMNPPRRWRYQSRLTFDNETRQSGQRAGEFLRERRAQADQNNNARVASTTTRMQLDVSEFLSMSHQSDNDDSESSQEPPRRLREEAKVRPASKPTLKKPPRRQTNSRVLIRKKGTPSREVSDTDDAGGSVTEPLDILAQDNDLEKFFNPSMKEKDNCSTERESAALLSFYDRLRQLYDFRKEKGHCLVPQKYSQAPQLGIWVNKLRMEKKKMDKGERSSLNDVKIQKLNRLGFSWGGAKGDEKWEEHFQALLRFRKKNGHCSVPTKSRDNPALGRFVSTQRCEYRKFLGGRRSLIDQSKIDKLNSIGFTWSLLGRQPDSPGQLLETGMGRQSDSPGPLLKNDTV